MLLLEMKREARCHEVVLWGEYGSVLPSCSGHRLSSQKPKGICGINIAQSIEDDWMLLAASKLSITTGQEGEDRIEVCRGHIL